ncbi:MAG: M24 family metallopeptidase, partial [Firmicutes bacterium]|nr:M24 family metallopeptidase [Bacillota bacterium]
PAMQCKAIKNPVEMEGIHSAHLRDGAAMCKFLYWLKTNVGKIEIDEISAGEKLHAFRAQQDLFMGDSFEAICGYGPHGAIVHYSATPQSSAPLAPEGLFLVDSGGQYLDGTTDVTRTIVLGPLTENERTMFTAVLRGHIDLARAKFPKGLSGEHLDYLAHAPLWQMGLDYRHGTGHGVGHFLNVHEDPNRIYWNGTGAVPPMPPFEEGMLTSDEPGYYEEGAFGIRHESLLLCLSDEETDYGQFMRFEEVTLVPFDLEGIDPSQMQPDETAYLNRYHEMVYEKVAPLLNDEERAWLREATRPVE